MAQRVASQVAAEFPDLCPMAPDPDQGDLDADGIGDVCDPSPSDRGVRPSAALPDRARPAPGFALAALLVGLGCAAATDRARRR